MLLLTGKMSNKFGEIKKKFEALEGSGNGDHGFPKTSFELNMKTNDGVLGTRILGRPMSMQIV